MILRRDKLYSVESPTDRTVLFAIGADYYRTAQGRWYLGWFDSLRGRMKECTLLEDEPGYSRFRCVVDGAEYVLRPITLEYWRDRVRPRVAGGESLHLDTVEALEAWYLERFADWTS